MASIRGKAFCVFRYHALGLEEMDELMCMVLIQAVSQTVYLLPSRLLCMFFAIPHP